VKVLGKAARREWARAAAMVAVAVRVVRVAATVVVRAAAARVETQVE
jgi:hypothetical protein